MRKVFPTLEYYGWLARVVAALVARIPAMAIAACLLLPLSQTQIDFQNNSKYVLTIGEADLAEADIPMEPEVCLVPLTVILPSCAYRIKQVVAAHIEKVPKRTLARLRARGPPLA